MPAAKLSMPLTLASMRVQSARLPRAAAAMPRVEVAADLLALLDPAAHATALARLPVNEPTRRMFDAMVRNTCAPTILQAGLKRNVIPSAAVAQLSGRPLPDGETIS